MSNYNFYILLKRGSYSSIGILVSRVSTAVASIIMARAVGPAYFGIYASLWAFLQVSLALSEVGMTTGIKRDGTGNHELLSVLLGNTLLVKVFIGAVALALSTFFYSIFSETNSVHHLIFPLVIIAYLLLFVEPFFAVLQVKGKQKMIASLQAIKSLLLLAGFSALAMIKVDLVIFMWFQVVLNSVFLLIIYRLSSSLIQIKCDVSKIGSQLYGTFFLGVSGILYTVYTQIPIIILTQFASSTEVGYFAVAYRFVELIFVVAAAACNNAFLPSLFGLYTSNRQEFNVICDKMQTIFSSIGIIVATSLYVCAEQLIIFLQGEEYRPAIKALHVMSWAVMLSMSGLAADVSLITSGRMRMKTIMQISVVGIILIVGAVIIRPFGYLGASYAICILWGCLFLLYFLYASYKRLIIPTGIARLLSPAIFTIMSAFFIVNYSSISSLMGIMFFFTSVTIIWLFTFVWLKKLSIYP